MSRWPKGWKLVLVASVALATVGLSIASILYIIYIDAFSHLQSPQVAPKTAFADEGGAEISLDAFRGKIVILNFWATWCHPCMKEMPSLDRLASQLPTEKFAVVTVNEDRGGVAVAKPVLERLGIHGLALYTDPGGHLSHDLGVRGFPTTVLIGRDGNLLGNHEGEIDWDQKAQVSYLLSLP